MELDKENVVQAVVLGDTFNNNFYPISGEKSLALFPMVGVPLIDFVLESLAQGGVGETILFCCQDVQNIKDHIKKCIDKKSSWSLTMEVHIKTSDSCLTMGDAMREIDASGVIKGPFILTGVNSISNIPYATLLEQHK
ncbi:Translation initiation factor eIF-2B subunit epsilon [Eumeta japonica]|uniref:Translation initiation factor eIF-2B subunit epsilon n=1 Tax=Eumeta variegata TaxID=151549 RepID=A0A4C1XL04_EUMVA|nr:Translation initiation factor eIF-2B subunit epsilon [Eumeta japonica]